VIYFTKSGEYFPTHFFNSLIKENVPSTFVEEIATIYNVCVFTYQYVSLFKPNFMLFSRVTFVGLANRSGSEFPFWKFMAFPSLISALKRPYRNCRPRFSGRHSGIIMTIGSDSGSG